MLIGCIINDSIPACSSFQTLAECNGGRDRALNGSAVQLLTSTIKSAGLLLSCGEEGKSSVEGKRGRMRRESWPHQMWCEKI